MTEGFGTGLLIQAILLAMAMVFAVCRQASKIKEHDEDIEHLSYEIDVIRDMMHEVAGWADEITLREHIGDDEDVDPLSGVPIDEDLPF